MLALWLLGCGGGATDTAGDVGATTCDSAADQVTVVMTSLTFGRRQDGVAVGFDLDGHVSEAGDDEGCGHADMVGPDGLPGVDSAFSSMLPALEATEASAVEGLIQDSIDSGELLFLLELSGVDDLQEDACVQVGLWRGEGVPMVGTDGEMLDHQTFGTSTLVEPALVEEAAITGGRLVAGPFETRLPLQILDVELDFHLQDAWLSATYAEDGTVTGYLGGAVPLADILVITEEGDLGETAELLASLVALAADMHPDEDGACQALSIVLEFTGKPAFRHEGSGVY